MATLDEMTAKIHLAHTTVKDEVQLVEGDDLAAQQAEISEMYRDLMSDLDQLRSKLDAKSPTMAEAIKNAIVLIDNHKAVMEQELSKPV